jgi:hypothetical protein
MLITVPLIRPYFAHDHVMTLPNILLKAHCATTIFASKFPQNVASNNSYIAQCSCPISYNGFIAIATSLLYPAFPRVIASSPTKASSLGSAAAFGNIELFSDFASLPRAIIAGQIVNMS